MEQLWMECHEQKFKGISRVTSKGIPGRILDNKYCDIVEYSKSLEKF